MSFSSVRSSDSGIIPSHFPQIDLPSPTQIRDSTPRTSLLSTDSTFSDDSAVSPAYSKGRKDSQEISISIISPLPKGSTQDKFLPNTQIELADLPASHYQEISRHIQDVSLPIIQDPFHNDTDATPYVPRAEPSSRKITFIPPTAEELLRASENSNEAKIGKIIACAGWTFLLLFMGGAVGGYFNR